MAMGWLAHWSVTSRPMWRNDLTQDRRRPVFGSLEGRERDEGMAEPELNAVTAAILADAAFNSVGDAIKLSTRL